ncbi:MAG: HEAT repeat domain-containing protein, partial [Polyangiaceae bacterium]
QLIDDVLRPIRSGEFICDLILNLDVIADQLLEHGVSDVAAAVIERIHVTTAADILKGLMRTIERVKQFGVREKTERDDVREEAERLVKLIIHLVEDDDRSMATDTVEELIETGSLLLEELPSKLRERIQRRMRARQMLLNEQAINTLLSEDMKDDEAEAALVMMGNIRQLAAEIVLIGGLRFLADLSIALLTVKESENVPRRVVVAIPDVLGATVVPELLSTLVQIFTDPEARRDRRAKVVGILRMLGDKGTRAFLDAILHESGTVRRMALDALRDVGPAAETAILKLLGKEALDASSSAASKNMSVSAQLACDLIDVLGDVGTERSATAVQTLLEHKEPKVRAATVALFVKIRREEAEPTLVSLLSDDSNDVLIATVDALGKLRSTNPELMRLYRKVLNPLVRGKYSDRMRMTACVAVARAGNIQVAEGVNAEQMLCSALGGLPRRFLFFRLPRGLLFGTQVNGLICRVLAQLGGDLAEAVLADICARDKTGLAQYATKALGELQARRESDTARASAQLDE